MKINIPRKIKNKPPTKERIFRYFERRLIYFVDEPIKKATRRKGRASPREKTDKRRMPDPTVEEVEARRRMLPRIGPTQGVQPRAKVKPKRSELMGVPGLRREPTDSLPSL